MVALRRLRSIAAAVAGVETSTTTLLEQVVALAANNRLVPSAFSPETIRELMVAGTTEDSDLTGTSGMTETERRWAVEMPEDTELGTPPFPLQDADGRVSVETMGRLHALEAAAAAEGRYEDATYLSRLQTVIDPAKPPLSYEDCSPEDHEASAQFFLENGFVIIRGAMSPDRIARVQASWERFAGPAREAWLENKSHCSGLARHYHANVVRNPPLSTSCGTTC